MKTFFYIAFLILTTGCGQIYAQECATVPTVDQVAYTRSFKLPDTRELRIAKGIVDIPYLFHVVRKDDGSGGIDLNILNGHIERLNELYLNANIRFVPAGDVNFVDNSKFYDYAIHLEESLVQKNEIENVINIYVINNIEGGYYGYTYHPEKARKNRIFMSKEGFDNISTFPHEMGHFFGLYHTHGKGSKTGSQAEPIARNADLNNNGIVDCYETGDDLCDTPADPNLGLEEFRSYCLDNCKMEDKIPAISGDFYEPQITNLMCYNQHSNCRSEFTEEQLSRISQTARNERKRLRAHRIDHGILVKGMVKFFLKDDQPMPLTLDVNLYQFIQTYDNRDTFDFIVENTSSSNMYLTIINMDVDKNVHKVFPFESDLPYLFPGEKSNPLDGFITLDNNAGREYVCLLISAHKLRADDIIRAVHVSKGTFTQRLYTVLGKQLLPLDNVNYSDGKFVAFEGKIRDREILPIMLEMEHSH